MEERKHQKLKKFDHTSRSSWLANQSKKVLAWAEDHLRKGIWPRDDYKELLELIIIRLGGSVTSFKLKFPGADHNEVGPAQCS